MKKKVSFILLFLITLVFGLNTVRASGPVMYVECPNTDGNPDNWVFYKVYTGTSKVTKEWYYKNAPDDQNQVDWCWFVDEGNWTGVDCNKNVDLTFGDKNSGAVEKNFSQGLCPIKMRHDNTWDAEKRWVMAGTTDALDIATLDQNEYVLYKHKGNTYLEYYTKDGIYKSYVNGEQNEIKEQFTYTVGRLGRDYFRLGSSEYVSNQCRGNTKEECIKNRLQNDYNLIIRSGDTSDLETHVENWYQKNEDQVNTQKASYENFLTDYSDLTNTCSALNSSWENGKEYNLSSPKEILKELNGAFSSIQSIYSAESNLKLCSGENPDGIVSPDAAAANCVLTSSDYFGVDINMIDKGFFYLFQSDVYDYLVSEGKITDEGTDKINSSLKELATCAAYINKNADYYGLSDYKLDNGKTIEDIKNDYISLAGNNGISIVIDCETLLGQDLIDKINSYLDIIKIAIPIILIGFGIFDFAKATFSGSEDEMKKAQQDFIKRLVIAILIFLTPAIVNFILNIANKVWGFISPDTCGLF